MKYLSGAKSVKQYRGDENLPEAKNGMKNCGCKHTKVKYKYQEGGKDISASSKKEKDFLDRKQEFLSKIGTGDIDLRRVTGVSPEIKTSDNNKYISYKEMSDEDKKAYKKGIASGKEFEVAGRKYAAVPKKQSKKNYKIVNSSKKEATVDNSSKEDSWTEGQWKDFLKKRNTSLPKPVPYIPESNSKAAFLDPKSRGVLMSQAGEEPKPIKAVPSSTLSDIKNFPKVKKTSTKNTVTPERGTEDFNSSFDPNKEDLLIDKVLPKDLKELVVNNSISRWPSIFKNYIKRKGSINNNEDVRVSNIKPPKKSSTNKEEEQEEAPIVLQDKDFDKRQYKQQSLDPDKIIWGYRNRGNLKPFKSEGLEITTFEPFSNKNYEDNASVIAIDTMQGKMEAGRYKDFKGRKNTIWSPTSKNDVANFVSDKKGNLKLKQSDKNLEYNVPEVEVVNDEKGRTKGSLNILSKSNKDLDYYGSVQGGRTLFVDPKTKKKKFVSGSLGSIKKQFDSFKKSNNSSYVETYNLDNGTYNKGLSFNDNIFDKERLQKYDDLNVSGGSGLYIKGYKKEMGVKKLGKYKYGTGAIMIPENSAIVTAKGGLNKAAVDAHLRGDHAEVERIIKKMPEDKPTGKYKKYKKAEGADALGLLYNPSAVSQATQYGAKYPWFKPFTASNTEKGRKSRTTGESTLLDPNDVFNQYNNIEALEKKAGRKFTSMEDLQGHIYDNMSTEQRNAMWKKFGPTLKSSEMTRENFVDKLGGARTAYGLGMSGKTIPTTTFTGTTQETQQDNNQKKKRGGGLDFSSIPSMAEIGAKASILGQGIEGVPENYLKLDRYNYTSQLPKTLRENQLAMQAGRESARDMAYGDAGRYMAQSASLSSAGMKANNEAVIADTLARQDIMNKNVDLGNLESQTNRSLKDQYAQQRAMNRGAYNNMLVSLGQSVDTATDASKLMSSQRRNDAQKLEMLRNVAASGNYDIVEGPDGTISYKVKQLPTTTATTVPGKARGAKKLKTYKRK